MIEAVPWTQYCYTLLIDNEPLDEYLREANRATRPKDMAGPDTVERRNPRSVRLSEAGQAFRNPVTPLGRYQSRRSDVPQLHFASFDTDGQGTSPVPDYEEETIMAEQVARRAEEAAHSDQEAVVAARRELAQALAEGEAPNSTRWSVAE